MLIHLGLYQLHLDWSGNVNLETWDFPFDVVDLYSVILMCYTSVPLILPSYCCYVAVILPLYCCYIAVILYDYCGYIAAILYGYCGYIAVILLLYCMVIVVILC